ncbi:hypothetical protein ACFX16_042891 [Malus domestica]
MNLHHVAVPHHPTPQAPEASGPPPRLSRQLPRLHHRGFHRNRPPPLPNPPLRAPRLRPPSCRSAHPRSPRNAPPPGTPASASFLLEKIPFISSSQSHFTALNRLIKEEELLTKVDSECLAWLDQQPPDHFHRSGQRRDDDGGAAH